MTFEAGGAWRIRVSTLEGKYEKICMTGQRR